MLCSSTRGRDQSLRAEASSQSAAGLHAWGQTKREQAKQARATLNVPGVPAGTATEERERASQLSKQPMTCLCRPQSAFTRDTLSTSGDCLLAQPWNVILRVTSVPCGLRSSATVHGRQGTLSSRAQTQITCKPHASLLATPVTPGRNPRAGTKPQARLHHASLLSLVPRCCQKHMLYKLPTGISLGACVPHLEADDEIYIQGHASTCFPRHAQVSVNARPSTQFHAEALHTPWQVSGVTAHDSPCVQ